MRIKKVDIRHYKAFYGEHVFNIDGKNIFIYGENGSGKSSFYYALKDFFQSSTEELDYSETENIFLTQKQRGKGHVKVTFNPDKDGTKTDKTYTLTRTTNDTYMEGDTSIRDAVKLKSFLTYKHLLGIHSIRKDDEVDLFDLLVKGVLKHFRSVAITGGKELGELWTEVENAIKKQTGQAFNITQKKKEVDRVLDTFNIAFEQLFQPGGVENILTFAQPILDKFGHNITLELRYTQARPSEDYTTIKRNHVRMEVDYLGKRIKKAHIFLNEARLSAIAISIYLGMVKRHVQGAPCKVLFLDDIFIGLDISNRLPLLDILERDFSAYQVFITTFDKPWYQFVSSLYIAKNNEWKSFEIYAGRAKKGFTIPIVKEIKGKKNTSHIDYFISQGEGYHYAGDNKAAGVYLRSAYEAILKQFCFNNSVPVPFHVDSSKTNAEQFWAAAKNHIKAKPKPEKYALPDGTKNEVDFLKSLVLNPLSHNDVNKNEHGNEITRAITALNTLRTELKV